MCDLHGRIHVENGTIESGRVTGNAGSIFVGDDEKTSMHFDSGEGRVWPVTLTLSSNYSHRLSVFMKAEQFERIMIAGLAEMPKESVDRILDAWADARQEAECRLVEKALPADVL